MREERLIVMQDAEDAFEQLMANTSRTEFKDNLHIRLALSALICSWNCVERTRQEAGF